jgi:hypothetical protein
MALVLRGSVVALAFFAYACASRPGQLSGAWVVAGSPGRAGTAQAPRNAQPIVLEGSDGCIPSQAFVDQFGNACKEHESEGPASTDMTGSLPLGPNPTKNEVRWYCEGRSVVRLVLERCGTSEGYRITDIAVWMGGRH